MTIDISWWLIPFIVTLCSFGFIAIKTKGWSGVGDSIVALFLYMAAIIVSLLSWFLWALIV